MISSLRQILIDELQVEVAPEDIAPDMSLRDELGLDSLSFVELRVCCERTFCVEIDDELFVPEHFGTLERLSQCIQALQALQKL